MKETGKAAMDDRRIGWVKFFSAQKGYGFLTDVQSNQDAFVHFSSLQRRTPGWRGLYKGEYVSFTPQVSDGKTAALDVTGVRGGPLMCEVNTIETVEFS
jgi:cold shock protein